MRMLENAGSKRVDHASANSSSARCGRATRGLDENVIMVEKLENLGEGVLLEAVTVM